jgi:hypothetical protein
MQRQNWETALSAQSEVLGMMSSRIGKQYERFWLFDRETKYGRSATLPCAMGFDRMVEDLIVAEPLYVAPEMHHLVLDAMQTFNAREPLHEEDVLFPCGFAYLSEPFLGPDMAGKTSAFRAIHWRLVNVDLSEEFASDQQVEAGWTKCLKITLWSHVEDPDDYTEVWRMSVPDKWGILHTTTMPLSLAHELEHTRGEGDRNADWITYLRVLHRLMAERIVMKSRRKTSRPVWRDAKRKGMPEVKEVIVVELRRVTVKHDGESGEAHYSHRFMVRGHWRNQWYESLKIHRQKWISPYVKGPDDAPFMEKERVWVWDR